MYKVKKNIVTDTLSIINTTKETYSENQDNIKQNISLYPKRRRLTAIDFPVEGEDDN